MPSDYQEMPDFQVTVQYKHIVGVYREMWMEYLQSKGIVRANHLTVGTGYGSWPSSILRMREFLEDSMEYPEGVQMHQAVLADIFQQYNDGRRA
jgi:hypothetical protein